MGAKKRVGIGLSYRPARLYIGWRAGTTTRQSHNWLTVAEIFRDDGRQTKKFLLDVLMQIFSNYFLLHTLYCHKFKIPYL
jgi:hypothetical protein